MGVTRHLRGQGHPGGDDDDHHKEGGEPDSSGGPFLQREDLTSWPTLIIEAGDSSTLGGLRSDMRWWFHASGPRGKSRPSR